MAYTAADIPLPKMTFTFDTRVANIHSLKTQYGPWTNTVTYTVTQDGEQTKSITTSGTFYTNAGLAVTVTGSQSHSNTGTSTTSAKLSVGTPIAGVYMQTKTTTTNNSPSTTTAVVGAEVSVETPEVKGFQFGAESSVEVGIKQGGN